MLRRLNILVLAALLIHVGQATAEGLAVPEGCKLADDDPLRAEVNRAMKEGTEFEERQRAALEDKVTRLGRARGWSKAQEREYLKAAIMTGINGAWAQTLSVVATFVRVCEEQTDGNQRVEAVRLFRELYLVEERQWQSIHEAVDREIAASGSGSTN